MQTIKRELQVTPDPRYDEISAIRSDNKIQRLSTMCYEAELALAAESLPSDYIIGSVAETDEEGRLCRDAVELGLQERLGHLTTALTGVRDRRFVSRVEDASHDGIAMELAEACHEALIEIAAKSTPRYFAACGVVVAGQQGEFSMSGVTEALHTRLMSLAAVLNEIRAYTPACGTSCHGCRFWREVDGVNDCSAGVTWASGIAPMNPHCFCSKSEKPA